MAEYGACETLPRPVSMPTRPRQQPAHTLPIFLENPDGTITEAIPSTYKEKTKSSRNNADREGGDSDSSGSLSEAAAASMYQEVEFLYSRHERVFMLLLFVQLLFVILYDVVYVMHMQPSVVTLIAMYSYRITPKVAETIFWVVFAIQLVYSSVYYGFACVAVTTKQPKPYQIFANWSLAGVVGLVFLAYVDKFNLLIFFLQLLGYIYARFLQGLTASLLLLPPSNNR
eukprot:TRINITY_DN63361_c0_g1_i1.p1 TRINITY_DN63361_c0_g1~~TRINITY_DN63361_c0_g1_i1.p1  ORF type:complete len:228 (-),score=44.19 TRINITY_DN63361_c0_g1_i1:70-753(-)